MANISWEGEVLSDFPAEIKADIGFCLFQLQQGKPATLPTRRMSSIGSGVYELKNQDERAWYRVIYLAKIEDTIYVLHSFEKHSRKTDRRDLAIAKERLSRLLRRLKETQNAENRK